MIQRLMVRTGLLSQLTLFLVFFLVCFAGGAEASDDVRGRDLGIPFEGTPGSLNTITDVSGVEVGHVTLISGEGKLVVGEGPVRTGVTAIFPLGKGRMEGVAAGHFTFNGDGEMTGSRFVDEFGELHGPILLTNTLSVGAVSQAVIEWNRQHVTLEDELYSRGLPLVGETWDGFLNDIYGQHIKQSDVFAALNSASDGPVAEGNVGGGTGMTTFDFSGGIGTASRVIETQWGSFMLGVLVQANFGVRAELRIAGEAVGKSITDLQREYGEEAAMGGNSIIVIIATDAPLIPTQLKRLARRATLGLGRVGSNGHSGSGDIFLAFSTANPMTAYWGKDINELRMLPDMNPLFAATAQATEEAIINAMVAATDQTGVNNNRSFAIPKDRLKKIFGSGDTATGIESR